MLDHIESYQIFLSLSYVTPKFSPHLSSRKKQQENINGGY